MSDKRHIGVIGAGSIGCWLGGRLRLAGHNVAILREEARKQSDSEIIVLKDANGEERVTLSVLTDLDPKPDVLLIAVKAMYLPDVAPLAAANIGPDTVVLPLQNGVPFWFLDDKIIPDVDPVGSVKAAIPYDRIIGNVVHASASRSGDWIEVKEADRLLLGEPSGSHSSRIAELVTMFRDAGIPAVQETDIRQAIWYKLWGNLTVNPISALTGETVDRLLADPQVCSLIRGAMDECRRIGEAIGLPISESVDDRLEVTRKLGVFKTSMLQDLEAGRRLEWQALVAAPRAIAQDHEIDTPHIDALLGLIRLLDRSQA